MRDLFMKCAPLALALAAYSAPPAHAALTLTADGVSKGFTLSLFVDQVPASGYCCGPLGIATNSFGQVVMQAYPTGKNWVFNDVDNQHFSAALSSASYSSFSYGAAITNSGGNLFATNNDAGGVVYKLNPDGSINSPLTGTGVGGHGIWTNPITGHLVAANGSTIRDIDPVSGTNTIIVNGIDVDGVSVSKDGTVVYGAGGGHVFGWNYSGTLVYDSGFLGNPDGTGVIQGNNLFSGDIIANDNSGNVWLLDPVAHTSVIIANGGSRGDYVGVDGTNGTLFLTQTDSVYRLGCGPDCFFTPPPVPEPETYALMLGGLALLGWVARRRRVDV
jgi:hypothetical protein